MMRTLRIVFVLAILVRLAVCQAQEVTPMATAPAPMLRYLLLPPTGSLWNAGSTSLYFDTTAHAVGDLLTVVVLQDSSAATQARHETSKSLGVKADAGTGFLSGFKGMAVKSERGTNGSGVSSSSTRLLDRLTVTVTEVLPNGNLRVAGSRCLTLEQDTLTLTFSGVVRVEDICPDNTVSSINIAEQCLVAKGNGPIAEKQRPGWFSRLLALLF